METSRFAILGLVLLWAGCAGGTAERIDGRSAALSSTDFSAEVWAWLDSLAVPDDGAIFVHHSPGKLVDGRAYYQVVPFTANVAMLGLLRSLAVDATDAEAKHAIIRGWIGWYARQAAGAPDRRVRNRWYWQEGEQWHSSAAPPFCDDGSIDPWRDPTIPCHWDDATDSYAATFLSLVAAYGALSPSWVADEVPRELLLELGLMVSALRDTDRLSGTGDGLTRARPTDDYVYPKLTMGNAETFSGFESVATLLREVYGEPACPLAVLSATPECAAYWDALAADQHAAVLSELLPRSGPAGALLGASPALFHTLKEGDQLGRVTPANMGVWYSPSKFVGATLPIIWPQLFNLLAPESSAAQAQLQALEEHWGEHSRQPDWAREQSDASGDLGKLWPAVGFAAAQAAGPNEALRDRARTQAAYIKCMFFADLDAGPGYPFVADDAGWLLALLSEVSPASLPESCPRL